MKTSWIRALVLPLAACASAEPPAPPACRAAPVRQAFRLDHVELPATARLGAELAFDLDGDGRPENAAGVLWSSLLSGFETAMEALPLAVDAALADGRASWLLELSFCPDEASRHAEVVLARAHGGPGGYTAVADDVRPAAGVRVDGRVRAAGGLGVAPVSTLADVLGTHPAAWMAGRALAVELAPDGAGGVAGRLGLALPDGYQRVVAPPLADYFTARLRAGTSQLAARLDGDGDGRVSEDELLRDDFLAVLLAPDLDLVAPFETDPPSRDGLRDSLSLGIGFHAIPVTLAPR